MGDKVEKTVLIRSGCFGRPLPDTAERVRETFKRAVEAVPGCEVVADRDTLKFSAPDEESAQKVAELLKKEYLGGVFMGLRPSSPQ